MSTLGRRWGPEQVYAALHEDGCKVVGPIRTRDEDLVAAAAMPEANDVGFTVNFACEHADCGATFSGRGTYATAVSQARAAFWVLSSDGFRGRCPGHAATKYEQVPLFVA